ncbi:hypothetical protein [Simiduia agarivorans]|uniref:Uncharacterized protein n=1 Tax=Simiduia agarivorans (strain DSM 21679 / JCM 13881 / BCRC 17597 / SA1) TaxID=1117647 RepID=K4L019_SIMAS|nr:hypothetical protein [Simiduia agarivorans]AFU99522.1 hypothetical protein M5M_11725 [Simiduia agarivorans SA1 = DSM 21679]
MRIALFAMLFLVAFNVHSHTDTNLKLNDGYLIGLPENYSPAKFDFNTLTLSISGKTVTFPECVRDMFAFEVDDLQVTASWYHDIEEEDSLPPYITIGSKGMHRNYLLINMDTLKPVALEWGYGGNESDMECIRKFNVKNT